MSMRITPHFTASEFACRDGTPYPAGLIATRLRPLCEQLELIRAAAGCPIRILSGYRTSEYNRRIGSAPASRHVVGDAADMDTDGRLPIGKLHDIIIGLIADGKIRQGGVGLYPTFVHYDIRGRKARWTGSRTRT